MNIISFNIWENKYKQRDRIKLFLKKYILKNSNIDVLLLQCVTNNIILYIIKKLKKYKLNYYVSNINREKYEIIATKHVINYTCFKRFTNSKNNRGITRADIYIKDKLYTFISTEFNSDLIKIQMRSMFKYLNNIKYCILCTTIEDDDNKVTYKNIIPDNWYDVYNTSNKTDVNKYTVNSLKNSLVVKDSLKRIDRIYNNFKCKTELTLTSGNYSTHYGLYAQFYY